MIAAALASACGGSSADPDAVAEDLAQELCDLSFRCCSRGEVNFYLGPYVGQDDCADRLVNSASLAPAVNINLVMFENVAVFLPNLHALDQAVADGRTTVDRDAVDGCIDYLSALECNAPIEEPTECIPPELGAPLPCDPRLMFRGSISEGGRCSSVGFSFECEEGLVCRGTGALGTDGACVEPGGEDDYCFTDSECGIDLYCSQFDGTCQFLGQAGEVCAYADPDDPAPDPSTLLKRCDVGLSCDPISDTCVAPCDRGATCEIELDCDSTEGLLCIEGRCDIPRGAGLPCETHEQCAEGLRCLQSQAEFGVYLCGEPRPNGQPCDPNLGHDDCASGYCELQEDFTGECAAAIDVGDTCDGTLVVPGLHAQCDDGYCDASEAAAFVVCDSNDDCIGDCAPDLGGTRYCLPYCAPQRDDGDSCVNDFECLSSTCIVDTCETLPLDDGDVCEDALQCESEFCNYEFPRQCDNLPLPDGKNCAFDEECESGVCDGICTPGLTEGSECEFGGECGRDLYCDFREVPAVCVPVKDTGEVCEADFECRGTCDYSFGRLACDDTPAIGEAICDGDDAAESDEE
jgi:hypothetical protein